MIFSARRFAAFSGGILLATLPAYGQAVPYAKSFSKPKGEIEKALKELQAYSGQKLPLLDGFVAQPEKPLENYERGFYQFTLELVPDAGNATIVRVSAKITAWYADRDVTKSGYQVLASNGRLELDLLDRLDEKLNGRIAAPISAASRSIYPSASSSGSGWP